MLRIFLTLLAFSSLSIVVYAYVKQNQFKRLKTDKEREDWIRKENEDTSVLGI